MRPSTASLLVLAVSCWSFLHAVETDAPTFEERVRAQQSLERVYYSHQIGATRPFEEAVSRALLERKVRTYLGQSLALERFWNTPVTEEMLRAEVARMERGSRMPDRLRELYGALGNDPLLIRECLARPILASRLIRNFFARDPAVNSDARREAERVQEELVEGRIDPDSAVAVRTVHGQAISAVCRTARRRG